MARVQAEQHIVITGHSTRPSGIVMDLLVSVILYWHIWLRNFAHISLDSGVNTLSAGHSNHNYLFQSHSATMQEAAPYKPTAALLITVVLFIPPVTKIPHCTLSTSCWDILHAGSVMCHVLRIASHCILQIPVRYPRHSSPRKQWMGRRKQRLLITVL